MAVAQYFFTAAAWTQIVVWLLLVRLMGLMNRSSTPLFTRLQVSFLSLSAIARVIKNGDEPIQWTVKWIKRWFVVSAAFLIAGLCSMAINASS